jgi:hypothetical protein
MDSMGSRQSAFDELLGADRRNRPKELGELLDGPGEAILETMLATGVKAEHATPKDVTKRIRGGEFPDVDAVAAFWRSELDRIRSKPEMLTPQQRDGRQRALNCALRRARGRR